MAENRRGKEKRFYFSRGQLFMLAVGFAAASIIIFFLGILVGQGIEERKLAKSEEPLVKIPTKTGEPEGASAAAGARAKEELTFYDTLTKPPPRTLETKEDEKPSARAEKTAETETKEEKPAAKEPGPAKMEKGRESSSASAETSGSPPADRQGVDRPWTVQVNAFPDEPSARTWVDRLKNKGYNAYMAAAEIKGRTWYRVRVGHYATREEAEEVEGLLRNKENLTKSFATSR